MTCKHTDINNHQHQHSPKVSTNNEQRILWVFIVTAIYTVIQAVGGWLAGSLALIADSGHMAFDSAALLLALVAYHIAKRKTTASNSYGFQRVRVLAALANGITLLLLVAWIVWQAIIRLQQPSPILTTPMLWVAIIGLVVNLVGALILLAGDKHDSNLRGALLHIIGDLLGSVGAIAAAIGIMLTGWLWLDPVLSLLVSLLVVRSAWKLVVNSIQILLQATPANLNISAIEQSLLKLPEIAQVGHLHIWSLADNTNVATIHVSPSKQADALALPNKVSSYLKQHYNIEHVTVQVDYEVNLSHCLASS